jgi:putative oxidoreductase
MIRSIATLIARLIFGGTFLLAAVMKFTGMAATAGAIAGIGFPFPLFFAWVAAFFELGLVLAFVTGAFFTEAAILAAAYVLFLGFAFYGPSSWAGDPMHFGFFVNHIVFIAGLIFAAVHGPGRLAMDWTVFPAMRGRAD